MILFHILFVKIFFFNFLILFVWLKQMFVDSFDHILNNFSFFFLPLSHIWTFYWYFICVLKFKNVHFFIWIFFIFIGKFICVIGFLFQFFYFFHFFIIISQNKVLNLNNDLQISAAGSCTSRYWSLYSCWPVLNIIFILPASSIWQFIKPLMIR